MSADKSRSLYCVLLMAAVKMFREKDYTQAWDRFNMLAAMTEDHASEVVTKRHHAAQRLRYLCETVIVNETLEAAVGNILQSIKTQLMQRKLYERRN